MIWPREHAINILKIDSKESRVKYLEGMVPEKFQEWVKFYVRQWWPRRNEILKSIDNNSKKVKPKPRTQALPKIKRRKK